jgi:hypothetical protein
MNKKNDVRFAILLLVLIFTYGCGKSSGSATSGETIKGTDGIAINFLRGNPQDNYLISDEDEPFSVVVEMRNKGTFPHDDDVNTLSRGQVYISGFDKNIIDLDTNSIRINREFLMGVSSFNPDGGFDTAEFKGDIYEDIITDKYEPTVLATLCYPYATKASPTVCIDPFPFDDKQKKVCKIGSRSLGSQGAPIAITSIDQEASSNRIQFKINLKNVGKGDVISIGKLDNCNPTSGEKLKREDFDKVELAKASVGFTSLRCGPFYERNQIRLFDGEGFIICSIDKFDFEDTNSAYTTPLNLEFRYGYRSTISKPIKITKITGVN